MKRIGLCGWLCVDQYEGRRQVKVYLTGFGSQRSRDVFVRRRCRERHMYGEGFSVPFLINLFSKYYQLIIPSH
jgi:hypothetical protein